MHTEQRMWPAGKNRGGESPLDPPPPDATERTAAHWLQPQHWLTDSPPCSPAADLASHANSNERATNTLELLDVDTTKLLSNQAAAMYLEVDLEREHNTHAIDIQKPPTTAQPALGDLGAQSTTVLVRVNDPSPISLEQPGSSANTTTTETILGQWAHGVPDVMTDETGKALASGHPRLRCRQTSMKQLYDGLDLQLADLSCTQNSKVNSKVNSPWGWNGCWGQPPKDYRVHVQLPSAVLFWTYMPCSTPKLCTHFAQAASGKRQAASSTHETANSMQHAAYIRALLVACRPQHLLCITVRSPQSGAAHIA